MSLSTTEKTQQFSKGLIRVFVVAHDTTIVDFILKICNQCNYQVATCSAAALALNLLKEANDCFDIILIDAQIPDLNPYGGLVEYVKKQIKIPIIMMSDDESESAAIKAFQNGADEFWRKPLDENRIKYMWHLVEKKKVENENKQDRIFRTVKVKKVQKKMGGDNIEDATIVTDGCVGEKDNNNYYQNLAKKSNLSWSPELREQFVNAVNQLGIAEAKPKKIVELMNVRGLTTAHVASHLQKWKLSKRPSEGTPLNNKMPSGGRKKSKLKEGLQVHHSMSEENSLNNNDNQDANSADESLEFLNLSPLALSPMTLEAEASRFRELFHDGRPRSLSHASLRRLLKL